jgi:hypothetical protein
MLGINENPPRTGGFTAVLKKYKIVHKRCSPSAVRRIYEGYDPPRFFMAIIYVYSEFSSWLRHEPGYWEASFDVCFRGSGDSN